MAILQFQRHMNVQQQMQQPKVATTKQELPPPVERPKLKQDVTEEEQESFHQDRKRFSCCNDIPAGQEAYQLFNCYERGLKDSYLTKTPTYLTHEKQPFGPNEKYDCIKYRQQCAPHKILSLRQDQGQNTRDFFVKVKVQATTCNFRMSYRSS